MAEYKVGDRGVTRDGRVAECVRPSKSDSHPLWWKDEHGSGWTTTKDGLYYGGDDCERALDIVRLADDAKAEPTCNRESETICSNPPSTLRTRASFSSDEHVIGGVHLIATCGQGKVSLHINDKELSESEAAAVLRTIETVMKHARRAKGVMSP